MAKLTPVTKGFVPKGVKSPKSDLLAAGQAKPKQRNHTGLLSVVGTDGRIRETKTELTPWRMICSLRIRTLSGARFIGTGWFVGPSTVLTAGHCIKTRGETAAEIEIIPGRDGDVYPFGVIKVGQGRMDVHRRWADSFDQNRDVGVLHLPGKPGLETGWFATAAATDETLEGLLVNVAGYPGTLFPNTDDEHHAGGRELWWHRDALGHLEQERIYYVTDTTGGQSGGPVWSYTDQGGAPIAVGIHAYGTPGGISRGADARNSSPRIDEPLAELIAGWIDKSNQLADADVPELRPSDSGRRTRSIAHGDSHIRRLTVEDNAPGVSGGSLSPIVTKGSSGSETRFGGTPTETELMTMLQDPAIPMECITPWLREVPELSQAFTPRFEMALPPQPGELRPEGAFVLNSLNSLVRAKRQWSYRWAARQRPGDFRLVSDGDSWFLHPLIKETWDHLFPDHLIYSLDGAGDLVSDISRAREAIAHMRRIDAHGVMLSGGGNDLLSDGALALVLQSGAGDQPEAYFDQQKFNTRLSGILADLRSYITAILAAEPQAHVFLHGYDRARPMPGGKWLSTPMQGIVPDSVQASVVALFIDRFNDAMIDMASDFGSRVHHIDMRGAAPHPWYDEIHPSDGGYDVVAARFDYAIRHALRRSFSGMELLGESETALPVASTPRDVVALPALAPHMLQPVKTGAQMRANRRYVARMVQAGRSVRRRREDGPAATAEMEAHPEAERVILPALPDDAAFDGFSTNSAMEVILGENDLLAARFLRDGAERAAAVCRIVRQDNGKGTGTLLKGGFLLTNWHVLPDENTAAGATAQFGFEEGGNLITVSLRPERFCLTNAERDFAIVACDTDKIQHITPITLPLAPSGLIDRARLNIIQHPRGRKKEVALRDNRVLDILSGTLRYRTDTEAGSSGSAVFDDSWQLVALHRAGAKDAFNEAIRIEAITGYLEVQIVTGGPQAASDVRSFLSGSAPELGFFGRQGAIRVGEDGSVDPEVELPTFAGDGEFADIGFWNIENLFDFPSEQRIERVADLLIAMNMDAMGLSEISEDSIKRTVAAMNSLGENAGYVFLNAGHRRDLAIIFDRDTAKVTLLDAVSDRHADLINSRIDGKKIFPRKPLIAKVTVGDATFAMIVVHLKSKVDRNPGLATSRRRAAADALRVIVDDIRANEALPVAVGGDFNEDLTTDVLTGLTEAPDFLTLTANDQEDGAISFVGQRHRSLIDHVVVSNDLKLGDIAGDDLAIVRFDRSIADFAGELSDHVPLVMRLVMREEPVERRDQPEDGGPTRVIEEFSFEIPEDVDEMTVTFT